MANDNVIAVRLSPEEMAVLQKLCEATGWNSSQLIRHLLNNATIRPAAVSVDVPPKNGASPKAVALVVGGL